MNQQQIIEHQTRKFKWIVGIIGVVLLILSIVDDYLKGIL
jgi:hypothetical protein